MLIGQNVEFIIVLQRVLTYWPYASGFQELKRKCAISFEKKWTRLLTHKYWFEDARCIMHLTLKWLFNSDLWSVDFIFIKILLKIFQNAETSGHIKRLFGLSHFNHLSPDYRLRYSGNFDQYLIKVWSVTVHLSI